MGRHEITLTVNGTDHELTVESRTLLVTALRDDLGYTGANVGCETGRCGACTVQIGERALKSCCRLAVQSDGAEIRTIEGLADDALHPLQQSFQDCHGLQCGYCTPGMVLTAESFLREGENPSRAEIREAIDGNLCRCTGYHNIVDAIEAVATDGAIATDGGETS